MVDQIHTDWFVMLMRDHFAQKYPLVVGSNAKKDFKLKNLTFMGKIKTSKKYQYKNRYAMALNSRRPMVAIDPFMYCRNFVINELGNVHRMRFDEKEV